jgi:hypothetical protein
VALVTNISLGLKDLPRKNNTAYSQRISDEQISLVTIPGANVIKLFATIIFKWDKEARMFFPVKPFRPG